VALPERRGAKCNLRLEERRVLPQQFAQQCLTTLVIPAGKSRGEQQPHVNVSAPKPMRTFQPGDGSSFVAFAQTGLCDLDGSLHAT
jgi:hypothetical protein